MIEYIKEVKAEMKNVTWPKRRTTISFTVAVLVISVAVAYYLGALDYVFSLGLKQILTN
ncbi:MAG: preprotein translocase subunit SecE [Candidatus Paceibacterota bacterium]